MYKKNSQVLLVHGWPSATCAELCLYNEFDTNHIIIIIVGGSRLRQ